MQRTALTRRRCNPGDIPWSWMAPTARFIGPGSRLYAQGLEGDQDNRLPTDHGFDEFFGDLSHLNTGEDPENYSGADRAQSRWFT